MKILMLFSTVLLMNVFFKNSDLNEVRTSYSKAVLDKKLCKKMIEELELSKEKSVIDLAYLGAYQTIWANHVFNPLSKLATFRKGKNNIELAISKEPENVEMRYIRFSVQKNAPSFLRYNSHLKEDKDFLVKNKKNINSDFLQKNIETLLK
ncbi:MULTISPECIES: hypothetical protein [unclassified Empedobacter]|uniref:hypothetical protein n=1 Tax=unclassified Empedobacter TaxID=2643773 RepID=UPI00244B3EE1|nr:MULTISPECIES: hypothetical protein [unclassified Empedobacter]MDH0660661.1 hypothetical protein [Empedobacter sp. GD03865]